MPKLNSISKSLFAFTLGFAMIASGFSSFSVSAQTNSSSSSVSTNSPQNTSIPLPIYNSKINLIQNSFVYNNTTNQWENKAQSSTWQEKFCKDLYSQGIKGIADYQDGKFQSIYKELTATNPNISSFVNLGGKNNRFCNHYHILAGNITPGCGNEPYRANTSGELMSQVMSVGCGNYQGFVPANNPIYAYQYTYQYNFPENLKSSYSEGYRKMTGMEGDYDGVMWTYTFYTYRQLTQSGLGAFKPWENPSANNGNGGWLMYGVKNSANSSYPSNKPMLKVSKKTVNQEKDLYNMEMENLGSNKLRLKGKVLTKDGFTPKLSHSTIRSPYIMSYTPYLNMQIKYTDNTNTGRVLSYAEIESSSTYSDVDITIDLIQYGNTDTSIIIKEMLLSFSDFTPNPQSGSTNDKFFYFPWLDHGKIELKNMLGNTTADMSVARFVDYEDYSLEKSIDATNTQIKINIKRNITGVENASYESDIDYASLNLDECKTKDYTVLVIDYDGSQLINKKCTEIPFTEMVAAMKPVIYAYPKQEMDINFKVDYKGEFKFTYPQYNRQSGWNMKVKPTGEMTAQDGKKYPYLFWDGKDYPINVNKNEGFVVKRENLVSFFEEKLAYMGLNEREKTDFITFWIPLMLEKDYYYINFANKEFDQMAPLTVTPKPDSVQRIFMVFEGLDENRSVTPQKLEKFERNGYSVIEWGGSPIRK